MRLPSAVIAYLLLVILAGAAEAAPAVDPRGTWDCRPTSGGTCSFTIDTVDTGTGAITGTGQGNGYTWSVTGTIDGRSLTMKHGPYNELPSYTADYKVEINAENTSMGGTYNDGRGDVAFESYPRVGAPPGPLPEPGPDPEPDPKPGPSGKRPSTTSVVCNRGPQPTDDAVCTVTVGDGGAAPAVTPTGTVRWVAERGAFRGPSSCLLTSVSGRPTLASCAVTFAQPAGGTAAGFRTPVTATYDGDGAHDPSKGTPAGIEPKFLVCVGYWSGACEGVLPKPDPVQTCVSAWQNCNGFGNAENAKAGTLDMSGLPDAVTTRAGCDESAADPYKKRGKSARPAQSSAGALDRAGLRCTVETFLETNDPKAYKEAKDKVQYELNARAFRAEVDEARGSSIKSLIALCRSSIVDDVQTCRVKDTVTLALTVALEETYAYAAKPGQGVRPFQIDVAGSCRPDVYAAPELCRAVLEEINRVERIKLDYLAKRKKALGLTAGAPSKFRGTAVLSAAVKRRPKLISLLAGRASVAQGKQAKLRLAVSRPARKLLAGLRRSGVRRLRATAVVRATIIPGISSTRRHPVVVRLR